MEEGQRVGKEEGRGREGEGRGVEVTDRHEQRDDELVDKAGRAGVRQHRIPQLEGVRQPELAAWPSKYTHKSEQIQIPQIQIQTQIKTNTNATNANTEEKPEPADAVDLRRDLHLLQPGVERRVVPPEQRVVDVVETLHQLVARRPVL
jgi:hypothetical protein